MPRTVLITGGAGFIGSHVANELLGRGDRVRALDTLEPQVHGPGAERPAYLAADVELVRGDVRDGEAIARALDGVDAVVHFAARVGVGQSMYEIAEYAAVNTGGTAVLLEALGRRPVARLVVASSMSIYGEGLYRATDGRIVEDAARSAEQLRRGDWEIRDADGAVLTPVATPEWKRPALSSVYALTKYDQERLCLMLGRAYGIPTVALRFFNVYGPYQALSNPYTGVLAIFAARLLNRRAPLVFEDGRQRRDFVHVRDVARAVALALDTEDGAGEVLNIGSGDAYTIEEIGRLLATALDRPEIAPEVSQTFRVGDIRHCFADTTRARAVLGYTPQVPLSSGLVELADWLARQTAEDRTADAARELRRRGLTVGPGPAVADAAGREEA